MPMLELQLGGLRLGEDALTLPMKSTSFLTIIFAHLRGINVARPREGDTLRVGTGRWRLYYILCIYTV